MTAAEHCVLDFSMRSDVETYVYSRQIPVEVLAGLITLLIQAITWCFFTVRHFRNALCILREVLL
jgi:hypothetical protein